MDLSTKLRIVLLIICSISVANAVENLTMTSDYQTISLTWKPTNDSGKEIEQYIVTVKDERQKKCILGISLLCADCNDMIQFNGTNLTRDCDKKDLIRSFQKNETVISVIIKSELILPFTTYEAFVLSIISTDSYNTSNVSTKTGQYESSQVANVTVASNFPINNLVIGWMVPEKPNGEIINYYMYLYDSVRNGCLLFVNVFCSNYNISSTQSSQKTIDITCNYTVNNTQFCVGKELSTNITHEIIQPNSSYNLSIFPINGYGSGKESNISFHTKSYKPPNVTSLHYSVIGTNVTVFWSSPLDHTYNYTYGIVVSEGENNSTNITKLNYFAFYGTSLCQYFTFCISTETPYGSGEKLCIRNHTGLSTVIIDSLTTNAINNTVNVNWTISGQSKCDVMFSVYCNGTENSTNVIATSYVLTNLKYYTVFNVTVIPSSIMDGTSLVGVANSSLVTTEIGYPGIVRDLKCFNVTYNMFECQWKEPTDRNSPSLSYTLQCTNDTFIETVSTPSLSANISRGVVPDINYTCTIKANSSLGFGSESWTSIQIMASEIPDVINGEKIHDLMFLRDKESTTTTINIILPYAHFTERLGRIVKFSLVVSNKYNISYSSRISTDQMYSDCKKGDSCSYEIVMDYSSLVSRQKRAVNSSRWTNKDYVLGEGNCDKPNNGSKCNGKLSSNTEYIIAFRAYTNTGFGTFGYIRKSTKYDAFAVYVTVPIVIILLLAVVIAIVIYQRRNSPPLSDFSIKTCFAFNVNFRTTRKGTAGGGDDVKFRDSRAKISAFGDYYKYVMKDSCVRASEQFTEISQKWKDLENSKTLNYFIGEDAKNRFKNIKPYVHNMVTLQGPGTYINASRICTRHYSVDASKQCACTNFYIATQGPLGNGTEHKVPTIGDFWRMIVQYDVRIIIMLTKCVESYKDKCAQYWPPTVNQEEVHVSGDHTVNVRLQKFVTNEIFDERELLVSMNGKERSIIQLHFTTWPDHDCPNIHHFLTFYDRFNSLRREEDTVVVHCSAGVGRTGTFILIDSELRKAFSEIDEIEIYNTLVNLRNSRCFMVQIEKQYLFVHAIIYEYLKQNGLLAKKGKSANGNRVQSTYSYLNPSYE